MLQKIFDFFEKLFNSLILALKDLCIWVFDEILDLAVTAISALDSMFDAADLTQYISMIPPEIMGYMQLVGIDVCSSMIVSAIGIRMVMNFIPFLGR